MARVMSPMATVTTRSFADIAENEDSRLISNAEFAGDDALDVLQTRHKGVTDLATRYYSGDIIPPTTESQILRALKFAAIYHVALNAFLFAYAFFIPYWLKPPYYGGLDFRDFHASEGRLLIMGVVLLMPALRFLTLSWGDAYWHYGLALLGLEVPLLVFVALFWSSGLPLVVCLIFCNMANMTFSQAYWRARFDQCVANLEVVAPPAIGQAYEAPVLTVWSSVGGMLNEFKRLWGVTAYRSPAALEAERCGFFSNYNTQLSHVKALHAAYTQALDPRTAAAPWKHDPAALSSFGPARLVNGLLSAFVCNAGAAFAGLMIGQVAFSTDIRIGLSVAVTLAVLSLGIAGLSWGARCLQTGLGVAVAEKEWMAFDVVVRRAMAPKGPRGTPGSRLSEQELMQAIRDRVGLESIVRGRGNIASLWLRLAAAADTVGESYLAGLYWNAAAQTRCMVEAMTPYNFQLFAHAKWEAAIPGIVLEMLRALLLSCVCALYCGTNFANHTRPVALMCIISTVCFVRSISAWGEALQFVCSILGVGNSTHRHNWVAESIALVTFLFILVNLVIWLYLLPLMMDWSFPIGDCVAEYNKYLMPGACHRRP